MCVCVAKPVAVELRCHATALIGYAKNRFSHDTAKFICSELIAYVEKKNLPGDDEYEWKGYVFALGLFCVAMTQSIFFHQNFHFGMTTGMRIKSALIGSVYKKVN